MSTVSRKSTRIRFIRVTGDVSALLSLNPADVDPCDQALPSSQNCNGGARFLVLNLGANNFRSPLSSIARIFTAGILGSSLSISQPIRYKIGYMPF